MTRPHTKSRSGSGAAFHVQQIAKKAREIAADITTRLRDARKAKLDVRLRVGGGDSF